MTPRSVVSNAMIAPGGALEADPISTACTSISLTSPGLSVNAETFAYALLGVGQRKWTSLEAKENTPPPPFVTCTCPVANVAGKRSTPKVLLASVVSHGPTAVSRKPDWMACAISCAKPAYVVATTVRMP